MIDKNKLLQLMGGNKSLVDKMILSFRQLIENQIEAMQLAIRDSDFDNLLNQAHILKTQSSYMGLESLQNLSADLEKACEGMHYSDAIAELVANIESEIEKLRQSEDW
jgi:HPt (histidine-containing phosphotransfer) domain-containing protein